MNKVKKIPFDIKYKDDIISGKVKVITRNNRKVEILSFDDNFMYTEIKQPIKYNIITGNKINDKIEHHCSLSGFYYNCVKCDSDLFLLIPIIIENMEKEIKINVPEGYEIDKENSTFECIKFKKIRWRDIKTPNISGYIIEGNTSKIIPFNIRNAECNYCVFATEKQAKSALAMARISQIMANDERFGGVITDKEWESDEIIKYVIDKWKNKVITNIYYNLPVLLAFHTSQQRNLFLEENEDLIKQYLMVD